MTRVKTLVGAAEPDPDGETGKGFIADRLIFLDGLSPESALAALRRDTAEVPDEKARVAATPGRPLDQVVVDDHAYQGQWVDGEWHFDPVSLEMACRVAGWSTVERYGDDGWLLS